MSFVLFQNPFIINKPSHRRNDYWSVYLHTYVRSTAPVCLFSFHLKLFSLMIIEEKGKFHHISFS